ncbi:hypothetical protein BDV29DRAFT_182867 [Aspergillus leporis]|uniref:Uncharacterized protein n=1 Tax=Aspergillus leporis TaxID=41062 RepID=A0A5N5WLF1_9EURO|nr:hypothetical protein BDV29DRAFT_182867 [Aspergillus leporis]
MIDSRAESNIHNEQRALIQTLAEERRATDEQPSSATLEMTSATLLANPSMPSDDDLSPVDVLSAELEAYFSLVQRLISEIDACQSDLEQTQHCRIRNGVLKIHSEEIDQAEISHGQEVACFLSI